MDLREVGYDDRDWINLAQDRDRWRAYVRAAMNLRQGVLQLRRSYGRVAPGFEERETVAHIASEYETDVTTVLDLIRIKDKMYKLRRNCLRKDALEGMVNGRRVRGRRRHQIIDDIKIPGSYYNLHNNNDYDPETSTEVT
ncbi:hypothetical protein ANN_13678 [Periplaneta americana]|uniref:Uncharacterized protein n=1 Tax=Periplaneta americana TaxID=6978 RepID=A0ABQ8TLI4_PERAM|nr:hypothetical protein ANN_13678 [Periplaneta americana]